MKPDAAPLLPPGRNRIENFVRGSSTFMFSSSGLGWSGLHLEQRQFEASERPAGELSGTLLCLWNNQGYVRCDHPDGLGDFAPKLVPPGTISLYGDGPLAPVRLAKPVFGLFAAFDDSFLSEALGDVWQESNLHSLADGAMLQDKRCFQDLSIQKILHSLSQEAQTSNGNGRLFVDECIQSLSDRLAWLLSRRESKGWSRHKLDDYAFKRVCSQLRSMPAAELDLAVLAEDNGYSKRHLIRLFRAKTGRTPYQYLLDLRIENARRLMLQPHLSLLDIAIECGFTSHGHFTRAFAHRMGATPSYFRKHL